ncbi:MAG: signal peptidase I [Alphaproteobacteria bacterium]|nr:MAG: signal peptidase I [Alphaproteobacteria bacterium]
MNDAAQQVWSFVKTMAIAAFIAFFCIRGFVFEPFKIPSSSMMPTLHIGDYLIVSKFAYGNRLPLTDFFFWERDPKRGDIVVFKRNGSGLPGSFFGLGKTLFIKRIVAVPGDRIAYNNQTLFINGRVVTTEDLSKYDLTLPNGKQVQADLKKENLLGVEHEILRVPGEAGPVLAETVVREGMYVMVGDNRDNSLDSRFWQWPSWGFVPKEDIMGRAEFIFWSWDENWKPRLERIGNGLRAHMTIGLGQTLEDARGGATA